MMTFLRFKTRMHSSRMRTVHSSTHLFRGGGCLLRGCLLQGGICFRGVFALGCVCSWGVYPSMHLSRHPLWTE